jgi:hypothetical protein
LEGVHQRELYPLPRQASAASDELDANDDEDDANDREDDDRLLYAFVVALHLVEFNLFSSHVQPSILALLELYLPARRSAAAVSMAFSRLVTMTAEYNEMTMAMSVMSTVAKFPPGPHVK